VQGIVKNKRKVFVLCRLWDILRIRNTGEIIIMERACGNRSSDIHWYIKGFGLKSIAQKAERKGYEISVYNHRKNTIIKIKGTINRRLPSNIYGKQCGERILQNEFYIGTLVS
jgi:hypothetical protein